MKIIRALVSDFDNTLVDHTHNVTLKVERTIQKFINRGNIFSIATGRAYQGPVARVCKQLKLNSYQIVRGGSEIISTDNGAVVWARYIKPNTVRHLLDYLSKIDAIDYAAERGVFIYLPKGKRAKKELGDTIDFRDIETMPYDNVPKVVLPPCHTPEIIERIYQDMSKQFADIHLAKTSRKEGTMGIDITDGGTSKHIALLKYAELTSISRDNIAGIGDSYNDYPLLTACGYKIAMGDAPQELKEIADLVVASQEEDGIVDAINHLLN